jgi:pimeloyl-ACP methyl ester carboxylesterase
MPRLAGLVLLLATLPFPLPSQQPDGRVQSVLANGYRFAYVESGSGRPVVLVHGALGDYRSWDSVAKASGTSAHLIAYSRRYHAPNPWRPDDPPAGYETSAADLAAILRALRLDRPVLVGYSWGGGVVLQVALRYPDLVGGLVLAEPVVDSMIEDPVERARAAARTREAYARALAEDHGPRAESAVRSLVETWRGAGAWDRLPPEERERLLENAPSVRSSAAPQPAVTCAAVGRLAVPVLLVGGASSPSRFQSTLAGLALCLRAAERVAIPSAGHDFPLTHAAAFRDALAHWLDALPD